MFARHICEQIPILAGIFVPASQTKVGRTGLPGAHHVLPSLAPEFKSAVAALGKEVRQDRFDRAHS
jgi:hypothetical protein